jgi:hypothetical protein
MLTEMIKLPKSTRYGVLVGSGMGPTSTHLSGDDFTRLMHHCFVASSTFR